MSRHNHSDTVIAPNKVNTKFKRDFNAPLVLNLLEWFVKRGTYPAPAQALYFNVIFLRPSKNLNPFSSTLSLSVTLPCGLWASHRRAQLQLHGLHFLWCLRPLRFLSAESWVGSPDYTFSCCVATRLSPTTMPRSATGSKGSNETPHSETTFLPLQATSNLVTSLFILLF